MGFQAITQIPDDLPDSIEELNITCNPIESWPTKLPRNLKIIITDMASVEPIPYHLPSGIECICEGLDWDYWYSDAIYASKYCGENDNFLPAIRIFNRMKTTYFRHKVYNTLILKAQMRRLSQVFYHCNGVPIPLHIKLLVVKYIKQ